MQFLLFIQRSMRLCRLGAHPLNGCISIFRGRVIYTDSSCVGIQALECILNNSANVQLLY